MEMILQISSRLKLGLVSSGFGMAGILFFCLVAVASANLKEYNYQQGFNQHSHHGAIFKQHKAVELSVLQIPFEIQAHIDSRTSHNAYYNGAHGNQLVSQSFGSFMHNAVQYRPQSYNGPANGNSHFPSLPAPLTTVQPAPALKPTQPFQNVYHPPVNVQALKQQNTVSHHNSFNQHQENSPYYENHAAHQHQQHHSGHNVLRHSSSPVSFHQSFVAPVQQQQFNPAPVQAQNFEAAPQYTSHSLAQQQSSFKSSGFNAVYHPLPVQQPAPVPEPPPVPAPVQLPPATTYHGVSQHMNHQELENTEGVVPVLAPHVTKNFYFHVPPEDKEEQTQVQHVAQGPVHKHYRVIFIKAPSQSPKAALVRLAQAQARNEEKTVIYVLSKKSDPADIQAQLQQMEQPKPNKPEVYFIKYKTPDEAAHAQQQIQAQYDALGGTSHFSDEGVAPLQSVVGSLDSAHSAPESGNSNGNQNFQSSATKEYSHAPATQNRGYLPPAS